MFQFSIRDLFWLTVVVALVTLWWGEVRQRRIDGAELWQKYLEIQEERATAITLLAAEYQDRLRCDAGVALTTAEGRLTALTRQQRVR